MDIRTQIEARIEAAKARRIKENLVVRWYREDGTEDAAYPSTEEMKQRWIVNLKAQGLKVIE